MTVVDFGAELERINVENERAAAQATGRNGKASFLKFWNEYLDKLALLKTISSGPNCTKIREASDILAGVIIQNAAKLKE